MKSRLEFNMCRHQISHSPGRRRCQMPRVCRGGEGGGKGVEASIWLIHLMWPLYVTRKEVQTKNSWKKYLTLLPRCITSCLFIYFAHSRQVKRVFSPKRRFSILEAENHNGGKAFLYWILQYSRWLPNIIFIADYQIELRWSYESKKN